MFTKGFWLHDTFRDIAMEVIKVISQDKEGASLIVQWWNRGQGGGPFPIKGKPVVRIKDFENWMKVDSINRTTDEVPRYG